LAKRAEFLVVSEALTKSVESLGHLFARRALQRLRPAVHLDPRDDPLVDQRIDEGSSVVGGLANGLVEQNDAADELAEALGRQEHLPVAPAVLLAIGDPERLEAPPDRGVALVRRQDPLTGPNQSACRPFQSRRRHHSRLLPRHSRVPSQASPLPT